MAMSGETERCDCCDLPVATCGKAVEQRQRKEDQAERARALAHPRALKALYAGACCQCGERFKPGDPIIFQAVTGTVPPWRGLLCCGVPS